jgi:hypothetical protein
MCTNEGKLDRIIRIILGLILIGYGVLYNNYIVAAVGLIPLLTGIFGLCPLYFIFKINTGCKK